MTAVMDPLDQKLLDEVYSLAYEELRRLARAVLRSDRAASLTPTTLVNEAWLKLARCPEVAHTSPAHFRGIAARAMRQVLVDVARRRQAQIRGGGLRPVSLDEDCASLPGPLKDAEDVMALDQALDALGRISPRQAQLVEQRFFGGLSWTELGESMGISEATVMRDWRAARAWLACYLRRLAPRAVAVPAVSNRA